MTALDLAEDLKHFLRQAARSRKSAEGTRAADAMLETPPPSAVPTPPATSAAIPTSVGLIAPSSDQRPIEIVPKGLRAFDAHDADFFLDLLPGPRDRDGLPDTLRFWKGRIEETDPDGTFVTGLIYGPSGCGKSSLVRAGLLQRVQCLVMVRDDFWLAVSRFMRELEVRIVDGQNSALVDLFDLRHAEKVLAAFGRAFGALPEDAGELTKEQKAFLQRAVAGVAQEGKVVCVRLALFAEMMKGKPWTPASLKAVGGTEGIGVTFLEETFAAKTAPPEHRLHQRAWLPGGVFGASAG